MKLLIFLAIIIAIYFIFFRKKGEKIQNSDEISFEMVECTSCGTYIAKEEAICKGGKYFCGVKCVE